MEKGRLEAFSDGVFAIAITLLVLDLHVPDLAADESLAHALADEWPSYASYLASFLVIGTVWINHHTVFRLMDRCDRALLVINVGFLACVAVLPFPTALVSRFARTDQAATAAFVYGGAMVLLGLLFNALWHHGLRSGLVRADADVREVSGVTRSYLIGPALWAAATATAVWSADLALVLFAALVLSYVLSSSIWGAPSGAARSYGKSG